MCGTREMTVVESLVNRYLLWYLGYFGQLSIWFAVHFEQQEELFYSIDDTKSDARQRYRHYVRIITAFKMSHKITIMTKLRTQVL